MNADLFGYVISGNQVTKSIEMMSIQMNASLEIECNKFWAAGTHKNTTQWQLHQMEFNWILAKSIMKANEYVY